MPTTTPRETLHFIHSYPDDAPLVFGCRTCGIAVVHRPGTIPRCRCGATLCESCLKDLAEHEAGRAKRAN